MQISDAVLHFVLHNFQYQVQPHSIIVNHNIAGTPRKVSTLPFPLEGCMELLVCPRVCVLCNVKFFFFWYKETRNTLGIILFLIKDL